MPRNACLRLARRGPCGRGCAVCLPILIVPEITAQGALVEACAPPRLCRGRGYEYTLCQELRVSVPLSWHAAAQAGAPCVRACLPPYEQEDVL